MCCPWRRWAVRSGVPTVYKACASAIPYIPVAAPLGLAVFTLPLSWVLLSLGVLISQGFTWSSVLTATSSSCVGLLYLSQHRHTIRRGGKCRSAGGHLRLCKFAWGRSVDLYPLPVRPFEVTFVAERDHRSRLALDSRLPRNKGARERKYY